MTPSHVFLPGSVPTKDIEPSIVHLNETEKSPLGEILLLQSGRDLQANQSRFAHKHSMQQ